MVRADRSPWVARGLRVITTERPGFGRSTRLPGRGFAEHADDLRAVLDHLGVSSTFVKGSSGAAPHMLAFLAQHGDRARAATIESGAAPMTDQEVAQVLPLNRESHEHAVRGDREALEAMTRPVWEGLLGDPLGAFRDLMAEAPPGDQRIMSDPAWQQAMTRGITEALSAGFEGWVDEDLAMGRPWTDIDLTAISTSVTWWHSLADRNGPLSAAQRLVSQLPNATIRLNPDPEGGHLANYLREGEILDELLGRG
jgi:pimeloyl-ACP methyl ester carboxylesterase